MLAYLRSLLFVCSPLVATASKELTLLTAQEHGLRDLPAPGCPEGAKGVGLKCQKHLEAVSSLFTYTSHVYDCVSMIHRLLLIGMLSDNPGQCPRLELPANLM